MTLGDFRTRLRAELAPMGLESRVVSPMYGWSVVIGIIIGELLACLIRRWSAKKIHRAVDRMNNTRYRPLPALRRFLLRNAIRRGLKKSHVRATDDQVEEIVAAVLAVAGRMSEAEIGSVLESYKGE